MLFVISAFAERWVVEGDETFIDDGGFAMIAPWGEFLTNPVMFISNRRYQKQMGKTLLTS
jgi:hypothetical protein